MGNSFYASKVVLAAALAQNGTFTVNYPSGKDRGAYENAVGHYISALGAKFNQPAGITISFGATAATITYKGATTIPAGTEVFVHLEEVGDEATGLYGVSGTSRERITKLKEAPAYLIELGAPLTADPDGVCQSQSGAAGALTLNGALVVDGVAVFDVPRNVVVDSGGADTAVLTITGTDEYGNTLVEAITLNGTTAVQGKKAFKTVTSVVSGGTISNGAFVGTGDILGLPVRLPAAAFVQAELADGAAAVAGTFVAGLAANTPSTSTTADVRGTYDPNSACDGAISFQLLVILPDPTALGNPQFAG